MKALVFEKPDQPVVKDMAMPEIDENGVLLKMKTVGICHSDYELLAGRLHHPDLLSRDAWPRVVRRGGGDRPQREQLPQGRPRGGRVRRQAARPHPSLRLLARRRRPRVLHRQAGVAAQAAGRHQRQAGGADRSPSPAAITPSSGWGAPMPARRWWSRAGAPSASCRPRPPSACAPAPSSSILSPTVARRR